MRLSAHRFGLLVVLGIYLVLGLIYAARTPAWQSPDEPAHVQVIRQLQSNGCCPVIAVGDWDQALLSQLTSARFAPDLLDALPTIQYEDHQPPLYYLLALPVYTASADALLAVRLLSLLIGMGVVTAAYAAARALFPARGWLAVSAAAFTALIPQHLAMLAAANNDALAELAVALGLLLVIYYLRGAGERWFALAWGGVALVLAVVLVLAALPAGGAAPLIVGAAALAAGVTAWILWRWHGDTPPVWIGVALGTAAGLAFLTKMNAAFIAGVIALAVALRWWAVPALAPRQKVTGFLRDGLLAAGVALALGGLWWARNVSVYGFPDLFGLRAHDAVVVGQLRTADWFAQLGPAEGMRHLLQTTFNSAWGQFGWMALPLPDWAYALIWFFLGVIATGWIIRLTRREPPPLEEAPARWRRLAGVSLGAAAALVLLQFAYYNSVFYQAQGRYLFPALLPVALAAAMGLEGWSRLARPGRPRTLVRWAGPLLILTGFVPLNIFVLWRMLPLLAP
jgi:4-amino-4-deoxy-L-arabinose transferase-like glycosyltransferase